MVSCTEVDTAPLHGGKDSTGSWLGEGVGCCSQQRNKNNQEDAGNCECPQTPVPWTAGDSSACPFLNCHLSGETLRELPSSNVLVPVCFVSLVYHNTLTVMSRLFDEL